MARSFIDSNFYSVVVEWLASYLQNNKEDNDASLCLHACIRIDAQCLEIYNSYMSPIDSSLSFNPTVLHYTYFYSASSLFSILQCIIVVPKILWQHIKVHNIVNRWSYLVQTSTIHLISIVDYSWCDSYIKAASMNVRITNFSKLLHFTQLAIDTYKAACL